MLDLELPVQSVNITAHVVSSIPIEKGVFDATLCDKIGQWLAAGG